MPTRRIGDPLDRAQVDLEVVAEGRDHLLRLDLVVAGRVVVEVKSVDVLAEIHRMQLLTYLRLTDIEAGLLLNFNVTTLRQGIKRVANTLRPSAPSAPLR